MGIGTCPKAEGGHDYVVQQVTPDVDQGYIVITRCSHCGHQVRFGQATPV